MKGPVHVKMVGSGFKTRFVAPKPRPEKTKFIRVGDRLVEFSPGLLNQDIDLGLSYQLMMEQELTKRGYYTVNDLYFEGVKQIQIQTDYSRGFPFCGFSTYNNNKCKVYCNYGFSVVLANGKEVYETPTELLVSTKWIKISSNPRKWEDLSKHERSLLKRELEAVMKQSIDRTLLHAGL